TQHGANEQITIGHQFVQISFVRIKSVQIIHCNIEKSQTLDINIQNCDIGAETFGHAQRVHTRSSSTHDNDSPGQNARHAAKQDATATVVLGEKIGAHHH